MFVPQVEPTRTTSTEDADEIDEIHASADLVDGDNGVRRAYTNLIVRDF